MRDRTVEHFPGLVSQLTDGRHVAEVGPPAVDLGGTGGDTVDCVGRAREHVDPDGVCGAMVPE